MASYAEETPAPWSYTPIALSIQNVDWGDSPSYMAFQELIYTDLLESLGIESHLADPLTLDLYRSVFALPAPAEET